MQDVGSTSRVQEGCQPLACLLPLHWQLTVQADLGLVDKARVWPPFLPQGLLCRVVWVWCCRAQPCSLLRTFHQQMSWARAASLQEHTHTAPDLQHSEEGEV